MEDAASSLAAPHVDATTPAHPPTATQGRVPLPADDAGGPPSSPLPSSETGLVRKGSHEWASPRSQGHRGTPPPIPRRGSRTEDTTGGVDVPPRPRTPAQVLASRAQAAGKTTAATASGGSGPQDGTSTETPRLHDLPSPQTPQSGSSSSSSSSSIKAMEPESGPSTVTVVETSDIEREDKSEKMEHDYGDDDAGSDGRRTVLQLSVVSDAENGEREDDDDGDGRLYRREERGDTSTVDEESMYNDNEDDDEDEDAEEEEGEEEEEDVEDDHASIGTSDEYVNIHQEDDDCYENDDEDEQLRQRGGSHGDDSLTPDNTPPPSPPRPPSHHQQAPPALPSEWIKYVAESGHEYYYNSRRHASQWTRPGALPLSPRSSSTAMDETYHEENQALLDDHPHEMPAQVPVHVTPVVVATTVPTATPSYANALFAAVTKNDETAQLQELLLYEVDVNTVHASSGLTPLHVAVQHGNARGAAMLLDYGARVDGPESIVGTAAIETPLVMACRTNHATLVRLLVRYGASIYTRDVDGNTILHIAIRCWSDDVVNCLLEMDSIAAILNLRNAEEETPLHLAARHGNANAVRALMVSGAAVDVEDAHGRTPLVVSIMENRVDCAQLLQLGEAQHSGAQDMTAVVDHEGPVMYDDTGDKHPGGGRRDVSGRDGADATVATEQEYVTEAESLRVYLTQLLQHSTTDAVLASTVYQFMDAVQREMASMATSANEAREREETLLHRIDELTNFQSTTSQELAEARETTELVREQMEAKEHEFNSLQTAYESLASRATMLESIARSSQDKLRRERAEFARQEEYWSQTINNSLHENATLLQSVQSLQQQQQQHDGWSQPYPIDGTTGMETQDDSMGSHEEYEDTMEVQQSYEPRNGVQNGENEAYYSDAYDQSSSYYTQDPSVDMSSYYGQSDSGYATTTQLSAETTSVDPESGRATATATISPERVDAVWNRFFENMARASDIGEMATAPATRGRPLSPPLRNPTLSSTSYPLLAVLPPASAVFDCVRKDNKDRLHQLLLSGISPNVRDIGERGTPLHLASELGDLEAVMLLCEFGGDVEIRDENGNTPLLMACAQGHFDCTKFLLQSAANHAAINDKLDTALHLAAWDGSVECVAMLLEYGVDVLARNSLGLTALANLKTRSPLRHRFQDLVNDHPMAKTLALLEEAERLEMSDDESEQPQLSRKNQNSVASKATLAKSANKTHDSKPPQINNASWGRWILGSVFGSAATPHASSTPELGHDSNDDDDDDDDDDESKSDFEEAESSPRDTGATGFLPDYDDLRPPPEIEAALRRSKPAVASPTAQSPSLLSLPPPPPEVLDELEKRKLHGSSTRLLSPTNSATRFASPASIAAVKKPGQTTPTNVRSRYVDTFNSP